MHPSLRRADTRSRTLRPAFAKALTVAALAAGSSHAIFGIGGHYGPALGFEVESTEGTVAGSGSNAIQLNSGSVEGLTGFGVKLWIDMLPFIDLEATGWTQFGTYSVDILTPNGNGGTTTTPVEFDFGAPLVPTEPVFARMGGDLAVLYPFLKFPPAISLIKVYGGGGITFGAATAVLSADFAEGALEKARNSGDFDPATSDEAAVAEILAEAIVEEGFSFGMGGFVQVGAKAKPPVVPIAAYLDLKYHFLGFMPDEASGSGLTLELGGALAF